MQFILRQTAETNGPPNRRLAEAKSPKPQRRRGGIKKSLSFSGGPQSNSPSRSPKLSDFPSAIPEEPQHNQPSSLPTASLPGQPFSNYRQVLY